MRGQAAVVLVVSALCLSACGDDEPGPPTTTMACGRVADIYRAGLERKSDGTSVTIINATPSPLVKGLNSITVDLQGASRTPIENATIRVTPSMPDLGMRSPVKPVVAKHERGRYEIEKIYLQKEGFWEIAMTVDSPGVAPAQVAFQFCIEN